MKIRIRPFSDVKVEERKATPFKDIFGKRIREGDRVAFNTNMKYRHIPVYGTGRIVNKAGKYTVGTYDISRIIKDGYKVEFIKL